LFSHSSIQLVAHDRLFRVFQIIVIGADVRGVQAVVAGRDVGQILGGWIQFEDCSGEDQFEDQDEGHDRHRGRRGFDDRGDRQSQHVCSVDRQEIGDEVLRVDGADQALLRILQEDHADQKKEQGLDETDHCLVDQMREDERGHVQSRAVLPFDDAALLADGLDRVEDADPDACGDDGDESLPRGDVVLEYLRAQHEGDGEGDDRREDERLPALLVDEQAEILFGVDADLVES